MSYDSDETISNTKKTELEVVNDIWRFKEILLPNSAMIFETFDYNYHKSPLLAIGLKNELGNFIIEPDMLYQSIDLQLFLEENNHKAIYDYKRAYVLMKRLGFELSGVDFDLLLASYVINPTLGKEEIKVVADHFGYNDVLYDEQVYGKGAKKTIPNKDLLFKHIAKKTNCVYELKNQAIEELDNTKQLELLTDIEIPLAKVLGKMEFRGISIDLEELNRQGSFLETDIAELTKKIYSYSGKEFNIASPKQLGVVLFEDLAIPYPKKKATSYSTDIEILSAIRAFHPIVDLIIDYRAKTKLFNTYILGLKEQIHPDNKVHTIFQQALTTTGRLSSVEPNLQNIPIRTKEGHLIRKMFIPANPNNMLYSADYSQIELRVLAHMANVEKLKEAFLNEEDIHSKTAKEVFRKTEITSDDRRKAKAVNFGIVYGISAFGLAQDLGISNVEASNFIKRYYEVYPEINDFMEETIKYCTENGYVKTLKNRIRYIPEINSKIYMQREFAKRMAKNAPIQGSAADIIKIAMILVDKEMETKKMKSKMLVQVHDELVFEGFSLCENLAEGLGSYVVPLLQKWVGEVYLSEAQIRGLLEEIGKAEILPEWKNSLIPLENIKVKHCLNKPKAVDMAVNGFWYVINESIYLCMEKGGTEDVVLHIFDEEGTGRIDLRFAKNEEIGTIRMPKTIPDELIFILRKGYELWNSWQAS